ncbi:unnamed protein product [Cuscuta campestris]|uniref:Reverse transcriptase zinc-binding domain-containing protein n=1 Tax=Cuscuta campestris TaxID=132261 RepID=A0A484NJN0_9ASTE|nr:unnamed protein product [Cuscuta campestris]
MGFWSRGIVPDKWSGRILWVCAIGSAVASPSLPHEVDERGFSSLLTTDRLNFSFKQCKIFLPLRASESSSILPKQIQYDEQNPHLSIYLNDLAKIPKHFSCRHSVARPLQQHSMRINKHFDGMCHAINDGMVDAARDELWEFQKKIQKGDNQVGMEDKEKELKDKLYKAIKASYQLKCQQSKQEWIIEGDKNSKMFYAWIRKRRVQNQILEIKTEDGETVEGSADIAKVFEKYYTKLLGTKGTTEMVNPKILQEGKVLGAELQMGLIKGFNNQQKVTSICRNFLLGSSSDYKRTPLVKWEEVCQRRNYGGLGLKNIFNWNRAIVMKLNWDIANKKDVLWVKWIHNRYIRGAEFWNYLPRKDSCQYWKAMIKVREVFRPMPTSKDYKVKEGYNWLQAEGAKPLWTKWVWNKFTPPKFQVVIWLYMRGKLQTKDRLGRFLPVDMRCGLCEEENETAKHLFWDCKYAKWVMQQVFDRYNILFQANSVEEMEDTMMKGKGNTTKMKIAAIWAACLYSIWS